MIESKNDILPLLNKYIGTQHEWIYQFWMGDAEEWSGTRQAIYSNGVVLGKFRESDILTIQTLKLGVSDTALHNEIHQYYERRIKAQKELEHPDIMQQGMLEIYEKQFRDFLILPIDEWIENNCTWIQNDVADLAYPEVKVLLYLYYAFDNYDYIRKNRYNSDTSSLTAAYENIFNKQSQFGKYGIVPIDQHRTLLPIDPPRIYDRSVDKTFFTKNIPLHLLKKLSEMMSKGMVSDLAVRLLNEPGYKGKMSCEYLAEALERGEQFDFVNLGSYSVSKLYSTKYEDCLWVVIDPENIIFEELCEDFETFEDMVVTQVVHLQYKNLAGEICITHLDHEYIFYTLDEYGKRMRDVTQKGTAKQRMKSFKIDNSKIPFDFRCEISRKDEDGNDLPVEKEQFLCYVLECYFKHKDLLSEYFQKVNS